MELERYMKKLNFSDYKLSKVTGISKSHIRAIRVGDSEATESKIIRICLALGITPNELFDWDGMIRNIKERLNI